MKIYTSYFYQIRNFTPNMIPLSTAAWDPKWFSFYRTNKDKCGKDKRGVINGLRAEPFVPGDVCNGLCFGQENCIYKNDETCPFLETYHDQLCALDFNEIMARFRRLGKNIQEGEGFAEEPILVLVVYETPNNYCSERQVIHKWFKDNGYPIEEWLPK